MDARAIRPDVHARFAMIAARVTEPAAAAGGRARATKPSPDSNGGPLDVPFWDLLDHAQAAGQLGVSRSELSSYVQRGLIVPVRGGRLRRARGTQLYRPADV